MRFLFFVATVCIQIAKQFGKQLLSVLCDAFRYGKVQKSCLVYFEWIYAGCVSRISI